MLLTATKPSPDSKRQDSPALATEFAVSFLRRRSAAQLLRKRFFKQFVCDYRPPAVTPSFANARNIASTHHRRRCSVAARISALLCTPLKWAMQTSGALVASSLNSIADLTVRL